MGGVGGTETMPTAFMYGAEELATFFGFAVLMLAASDWDSGSLVALLASMIMGYSFSKLGQRRSSCRSC